MTLKPVNTVVSLIVSQTADLLGLSHNHLLCLQRIVPKNGQHLAEEKCLADVGGHIGQTGGLPHKGNSNSKHHWLQPRFSNGT